MLTLTISINVKITRVNLKTRGHCTQAIACYWMKSDISISQWIMKLVFISRFRVEN
jgi:hypothetical protein